MPLFGDLFPEILHSPILIVEDNDVSRMFLEKALQGRGFDNILSVISGEDAIEHLSRFQPELVLLDIMLPGMDGFQCCSIMRSHRDFYDLPILIQTSADAPEMRVKAFKSGATDFVSKPVYPDELCARVIVHLENLHSMKALQEYKSRVAEELENARQLQQNILPGAQEIDDIKRSCKLDIASYFQPSSEIGGDFWGMKNLSPQQTALWLADFSGHGVASALNAFRLQVHMREASPLMLEPGDYLSHLNDKLLQLLLCGQFATMFYGIVNTENNRLSYGCACTPHPIILRKETGKAEMIDGTGSPLGIGLQRYPTNTTAFSPGDMLLLYSDAFIETPNGRSNFITEAEIMALLERYRGAPAAAIKEIVLDHFYRHAGDTLRDDLSLVVCARLA